MNDTKAPRPPSRTNSQTAPGSGTGSTPRGDAPRRSIVSGKAAGKESVEMPEGNQEFADDIEDLEPTQFEDDEEPMRRVDQDWDDADEDAEDSGEEGEGRREDRKSDPDAEGDDEFDDDQVESGKAEVSAGGASSGAREGAERANAAPTGQRQRGPRNAPPPRQERRAAPSSSEELLLNEIPWRLGRAEEKLRLNLNGKIEIRVATGPDRRTTETKYLFDWSGDAPRVSRLEGAAGSGASSQTGGAQGPGAVDCTITVHEQVLLRIANGELNPQITMLSNRLKIEGQAALGIYFFNLVAPAP